MKRNMTTSISKTYSELIKIKNFEDRLKYLTLKGKIGEQTFGGHRMLNQILYKSSDWKNIRRRIILRDEGCDLAHEDYPIGGNIYIHHLNPISIDDILKRNKDIFDEENLVCVSFKTHNAIHYGVEELIPRSLERRRNDTCLW